MKTNYLTIIAIAVSSIFYSNSLLGQKKNEHMKFLENLPKNLELVEKSPQKYLVTTELFNRDIYGDLWNKVKVTGEYTRGLKDGYVKWDHVFIAHTNNQSEDYIDNVKQDYMENLTYVPSSDVLEESFFEKFENNIDNIVARNLIWDMKAIEGYAWDYFDSLQLNKIFMVSDVKGDFDMTGFLGTYYQTNIELTWLGITRMNNKLCAIIEYKAMDNKFNFHLDTMKSKGSDMHVGKIWVSFDNKQIEYAEIYSKIAQEMEIEGLSDKMLMNSKRIFKLERIR